MKGDILEWHNKMWYKLNFVYIFSTFLRALRILFQCFNQQRSILVTEVEKDCTLWFLNISHKNLLPASLNDNFFRIHMEDVKNKKEYNKKPLQKTIEHEKSMTKFEKKKKL